MRNFEKQRRRARERMWMTDPEFIEASMWHDTAPIVPPPKPVFKAQPVAKVLVRPAPPPPKPPVPAHPPGFTRNGQRKIEAKQRRLQRRIDAQQGRCMYCPTKLTVPPPGVAPHARSHATLEHIKPRHRGGGNDPRNLGIACRYCNIQKGNSWEFWPVVRQLLVLAKARIIHWWRHQ